MVGTLKFPRFWDARNFGCYLPKFQTKRQSIRVFCQNDENVTENSEDPDQTAPEQSGLGLHCLPRPFCPKT